MIHGLGHGVAGWRGCCPGLGLELGFVTIMPGVPVLETVPTMPTMMPVIWTGWRGWHLRVVLETVLPRAGVPIAGNRYRVPRSAGARYPEKNRA